LDLRLKQADLNDLRKELLQTAARFHEKFKEQHNDDPEVQAERADAYLQLGLIAKLIGSTEEAEGHFRQALAIWAPLVAAHPDNRDYRQGLATCYNDAANLYVATGRSEEAGEAYLRSLALTQELADAYPGANELQADRANTQANLALWCEQRDRFKEAEDHYDKALETWQRLHAAHPDKAEYLRDLADTYHKRGFLCSRTNRHAQAGEAYQQALTIRQQLDRDHPRHLRYREDLGWSYYNLGIWYQDDHKPRKAEEAFKNALIIWQGLADARPSVPDYQELLTYALQIQARFYQSDAKPQQAAEASRQALEAWERLVKLNPANLGYAVGLGGGYCNMGRRRTEAGDPKAALPWFDKAQATLEGVRRRDPGSGLARTYLRNTHWSRAEALVELECPADALKEWGRALELDALDADRAYSHMGRALALIRLGKHEQAVTIAEDQVGLLGAYRAARVFSLASGSAGRDAALEAAERRKLAEQYAARAVALLQLAMSQGQFKKPADVADLKRNTDLDPLRSREDFRKLLRDLQE
jgi:tetratricopeptide (TPR) repeat protein